MQAGENRVVALRFPLQACNNSSGSPFVCPPVGAGLPPSGAVPATATPAPHALLPFAPAPRPQLVGRPRGALLLPHRLRRQVIGPEILIARFSRTHHLATTITRHLTAGNLRRRSCNPTTSGLRPELSDSARGALRLLSLPKVLHGAFFESQQKQHHNPRQHLDSFKHSTSVFWPSRAIREARRRA